jgi:hypothetical protein
MTFVETQYSAAGTDLDARRDDQFDQIITKNAS